MKSWKKRMLGFLGMVCCMLFMQGGMLIARAEAQYITGGSSQSLAVAVPETDQDYSDTLDTAEEQDWYRFTTPEYGAYTVLYAKNLDMGYTIYGNTYANFRVELVSNIGEVLDDLDLFSAGNDGTIKIRLEKNTTYYIKCWHEDGRTGQYKFQLSFAEDREENELTKATPVEMGLTYERRMAAEGDQDWYCVTPTEDGTYHFRVKNYNMGYTVAGNTFYYFNLDVYTATNEKLLQVKADKEKTGESTLDLKAGTTYYICCYHGYGSKVGDYSFAVFLDKPLEAISFKSEEVRIVKGNTRELALVCQPEDTTDELSVKWASSDTSVATVSSEGVVKAVAAGACIVTATVGDLKAECDVAVMKYSYADTWKFSNPCTQINYYYFQKFFAPARAHELASDFAASGQGGQCYGMVTAAMAISELSRPSVSTFQQNCLYAVNEGSMSDGTGIIARDYIKYAFLYQFTDGAVKNMDSHFDVDAVYKAIKQGLKQDHLVNVAVYGKINGDDCGHAIMPIAILQDDENMAKVLVYDCNYPNTERYLYFGKSDGNATSFSYELASGINWNSTSGGNISYADVGADFCVQYNANVGYEQSSYTVLLETSADKLSVKTESGEVIQLKPFMKGYSADKVVAYLPLSLGTGKQNKYYYLNVGNTFIIDSISEAEKVSLLGETSGITLEASAVSGVTAFVKDGEANTLTYTSTPAATEKISFISTDENERACATTFTGTADGAAEISEQQDDSIVVKGYQKISVNVTVDGTTSQTWDYTLNKDAAYEISNDGSAGSAKPVVRLDSDHDGAYETTVAGKVQETSAGNQTGTTSNSTKKTIGTLTVKAKKGAKKITVKTIKGVQVKVKVNKKIIRVGNKNKKSQVITAAKNKKGKVVIKLSKKLAKKMKVTVIVSGAGYETKKKVIKL